MSSLHLPSTMFGQLMRLVSGNRLFKYPDEIDPTLWKQAVQPNDSDKSDKSEKSHEPPALSNKEELHSHASPSEQDGGTQEFMLVGWYGPDDPEVKFFCFKQYSCWRRRYGSLLIGIGVIEST